MWPLWKTVQEIFQKLRTQLPCNYWVKYYMPKRNETVLKRYLYTHIYSSIIHDSQKVTATQMITNRWMDIQNVVYACNGIWFDLKREGNSDTCCNIHELWRHYAKWNKSHKRTNTVWLKLQEVNRAVKFKDRKKEWQLSGPGAGVNGELFHWYRVSV